MSGLHSLTKCLAHFHRFAIGSQEGWAQKGITGEYLYNLIEHKLVKNIIIVVIQFNQHELT